MSDTDTVGTTPRCVGRHAGGTPQVTLQDLPRTSDAVGDERSIYASAAWLFGTTIVTSAAGFAFWWLAARLLPKSVVGGSGAAISAVQLLGTIGMLGLGTLLVGELSRKEENPRSLMTTGVLLSGAAGAALGLIFVVCMRVLAPSSETVPHDLLGEVGFIAVVAATSSLFVLDDATVGLRKSSLQLWRNLEFSVLKLMALPLLVSGVGLATEAGVLWAWLLGAVVSVAMILRPLSRSMGGLIGAPRRGMIGRHAKSAWSHHVINLTLATPRYALPVLVAGFLSPATNADFYVALLLIGFPYIVPVHLSTALFAVGAGDRRTLAKAVERVNRALLIAGLLSAAVFGGFGSLLLSLFGHGYATANAENVLAVLGGATIFAGVKSVYVAVCRVNGDLSRAAFVATLCCLLELTAACAVLVAGLNITAVADAWSVAMVCEALFLWPIVALASGRPALRLGLPTFAWFAPLTVENFGREGKCYDAAEAPSKGARLFAYVQTQPLAASIVAVTLGTVAIGIGYTGGRAHQNWAIVALWGGQLISFGAIAAAALSKTLSARERVLLVVLQAIQQSFVRWMYSPLFFTFFDEAQHWRSASDLLTTHHLFHPNPMLVVSPSFPGLEELTTALASVGHISLRWAALVEALLVHAFLSVAVFYLFRRVSQNARIVTVATIIFAVSPLHAGFDTMFVYEGPALVFCAVALELALSIRRLSIAEMTCGLLCLAGVVVTHHVTAAVTILDLGALAVVIGVQRRLPNVARRLGMFCLLGALLAAAWVSGVAHGVIGYLSAPLVGIFNGLLGHSKRTVPLPSATTGGLVPIVTISGVLTTAALVVSGAIMILRSRDDGRQSSIARAFAVIAFGYFGILGIRAFAADGPELSGRLLTFMFFFVAPIAAFTLVRLKTSPRRLVRPVAVIAAIAVFAGGVTSGWPAPWELVPGRFRVAAFESGMDRQNLAAALWFREHIGPNKRIACDFSSCSLLGAYAHEHSIDNAPILYGALTLNSRVIRTIQYYAIQYLFVDKRMSHQSATTGHYFWAGPEAASTHVPIAAAALAKYTNVSGVSLLYDSGTIEIYDVRALLHG